MSNTKPRFTKGKLVMLSRKNVRSGAIPFYDPANDDKRKSYGNFVSQLERGVPILLTADPEFLDKKKIGNLPRHLQRYPDKEMWKVSFLLEEKLYFMYLTNRQYNHELVKAVPRRLTKDYGSDRTKNCS